MTDETTDTERDAVEQSDEKPLYERHEYQPDNTVDLVLLLAAEDGATYASVREQLEGIEEGAMHVQVGNTGDPIPPDLGPEAQPEHREPDRALRFLTLHDYVDAYDSWGDAAGAEIELTERGHSAVDALRRGLLPEQKEALEDAGAETAPRVTDGGDAVQATGDQQEEEVYEIERVYTHRGSDRTTHHIKAADERAAERRLERLEERGETDDLNNEIESMAGNPLHVHVHEAWDVDLSEVDDAE